MPPHAEDPAATAVPEKADAPADAEPAHKKHNKNPDFPRQLELAKKANGETGITDEEAETLRAQYGFNELPEKKSEPVSPVSVVPLGPYAGYDLGRDHH